MQKNLANNNAFDQAVEFVLKNKFVISVCSGALALLILIITIFGYASSTNNEKANKLYDVAVLYLNNISYISNQSEQAKVYQEQLGSLNLLVQSYPKSTASIRARLLLGRMYYENAYQTGRPEAINMALTYYTGAIENSSAPFYKVLGLMGRATCYEQKGDLNKAFDDFQTIKNRYPKEGFAPYALIGMARERELQGSSDGIKSALNYYQQLIQEYPDSAWVLYAKGKISFYSMPNVAKAQAPVQQPANSLPFALPTQQPLKK